MTDYPRGYVTPMAWERHVLPPGTPTSSTFPAYCGALPNLMEGTWLTGDKLERLPDCEKCIEALARKAGA